MVARRVNRPGWLLEKLYPFQSHFAQVAGCQVHYVDEGSGPTLLLVHGNPTWSFLYRHIIRALAPDFRCIAPDLPGFGLSRGPEGYDFLPASQTRVLEQFVLQLDLRDLTLMVQDWGGPIALSAAANHPDRCRGLIIGNTFAWSGRGVPRYERFSSLMGGPLGRFLSRHFNFFVRVIMPAGVHRTKLSREVMACYLGPFATRESRAPTYVLPREIIHSEAFLRSVEAGLARIAHLPVLIVWGDRDFAFQDAERERFESAFANHRTVILHGAGHFIQEDAPSEIALAIRQWWQETWGAA